MGLCPEGQFIPVTKQGWPPNLGLKALNTVGVRGSAGSLRSLHFGVVLPPCGRAWKVFREVLPPSGSVLPYSEAFPLYGKVSWTPSKTFPLVSESLRRLAKLLRWLAKPLHW